MYQFIIVFLLFIFGCSPTPPDVFVFEYMSQTIGVDAATGHILITPSPTCMKQISESECGHGIAIVSGKEIFVGNEQPNWFNGKSWSKLKEESIYVPAQESYAPLATYIINSCKKMDCSSAVDKFKVKLNSLISGKL